MFSSRLFMSLSCLFQKGPSPLSIGGRRSTRHGSSGCDGAHTIETARRGRKYPPGLTKTRSGSLSSRLAELKHTWVIRRETMWLSEIGWRAPPVSTPIVLRKREPDMRKFHSIAALCGDGLRPELQALFDRLAIDPHSELFMRADGMLQSGPDPKLNTAQASPAPKRAA